MFIDLVSEQTHCILTIQRPDRRNALGPTVAKQLLKAISEVKTHIRKAKSCNALIVKTTLAGRAEAPIWIAGGDLKELSTLNKKSARTFATSMHRILSELRSLPMITVGWIDGIAIGGGAEFALFPDIRFATERSSFLFKQMEIGLSTGFGGSELISTLAGVSVAQKCLLLAEDISATQAQQWNLIHRVFGSEDNMESESMRYIEKWSKIPREIILQQKKLLYASGKNTEIAGFEKLWKNELHKKTLEKFS